MPRANAPRPRRPLTLLTQAGLLVWRACSGHAAPTLTPLSPAALVPRLLGPVVVPLLLCIGTAWRTAWRLLERS